MGSSDQTSTLLVGLLLCSWWLLLVGYCGCQQEQGPHSSFLVSSFNFPKMRLGPYEWSYMRVELPLWFSSMIMRFLSNVNSDDEKIFTKNMPIMCFRHGGPPLPDLSDTSLKDLSFNFTFNGSLEGFSNLRSVDWCIPFQKNTTVTLTNEQISPGVWYIGFFNSVGPERTQSRMITRGRTYMFSTTMSIESCSTSTIWGPYCNQTIDPLSCSQPVAYKHSRSLLDAMMYHAAGNMNYLPLSGRPIVAHYHSTHTLHFASSKRTRLFQEEKEEASEHGRLMTYGNFVLCNNSVEALCLGDGDMKFYSLDIVDPTSQFEIVADKVKLIDMTLVNSTVNYGNIFLMCYARYNAMPLRTFYDFSAEISRTPLIVQLPEIGRWFIAVHVINKTEVNGEMQDSFFNAKLCFSLRWEVHACPLGKAGLNCTWNLQSLQRISWKDFYFPFRSYYLPLGEFSESAKFPLEPLLSNSSVDGDSDIAWTYLLLDVPNGAAGANLHVQLVSEKRMEYEIYAKFGGIPSLDNWDYYANNTGNSNGSMMLMSSKGEGTIEFYILYVREGSWGFGLKHAFRSLFKLQTMMSISLEACPESCSSHGTCHLSTDGTGTAFYSFCRCDRDHGGFDCSNELISPQGHIKQFIFLVASNAAAIFPAFWALRRKAFAEWVLFTASGVSSGLYHACDVGTWCPLSFHVLQFMDFWLSFMAVVSTFVFLTTISEASKRAIHTCVSIITALLAATGATRSANIILVIAIGTLGLIIGWMLEFSSANRTGIIFSSGCNLNINERWQTSRTWLLNLVRRVRKRFHWHFLLMGFILLFAAGTSWKLESNESYWIWHSLWHITIYTSSFFFLCSVRSSNLEFGGTEYELTRSNSPRLQSTETQR
uniref:Transmembrane protein 8B n=2 Tax=Anthurium amnicola TaxID=1678845 RepID=A0A1D1Y5Z4_9ARAE